MSSPLVCYYCNREKRRVALRLEGLKARVPTDPELLVDTHLIVCPYCGESLEILVDSSIRRQDYVEDCQVCCRPITLTIVVDGDGCLHVDASSEAE